MGASACFAFGPLLIYPLVFSCCPLRNSEQSPPRRYSLSLQNLMASFSRTGPEKVPVLSMVLLAFLGLWLGWTYRISQGFPSRPMHADEAILAIKSQDYARSNHFHYDPRDYHGPGLHQFQRAWAWLCGRTDPESWTESNLRSSVSALSFASLLLCFSLWQALGPLATVLAMLLSACSPMLAFYAGYYIMETQLVFLDLTSLMFFWRYIKKRQLFDVVMIGVCLGLSHATKETFILGCFAWLPALLLLRLFNLNLFPAPKRSFGSLGKPTHSRHWLWLLSALALTSALSFSGGFSDWGAVWDSFACYLGYFQRSGDEMHAKPFSYYLDLLLWQRQGLTWGEWLISLFALLGVTRLFIGRWRDPAARAFGLLIAFHAICLLLILSLLSYKTPWCILTVLQELALIAGLGAAWLWQAPLHRWVRRLLQLGLIAAVYSQSEQCLFALGPYRADARNPMCYSHPSTDLLNLVADLQRPMQSRPNFSALVVQRDQGWPLPWYWRGQPRVGYLAQLPPEGIREVDALIVESQWLDEVKQQLGAAANQYEESRPYGMRPGILLIVLLRKDPLPSAQERANRQEFWRTLAAPPSLPLPRLMPALPESESSIISPPLAPGIRP